MEPDDARSDPVQVAVIIVGAGRGSRFGGELPKQYVPLGGACALRRSIEAFLGLPRIGLVRAAIHVDDGALYGDAVAGIDDLRLVPPISGGASRALTVRLALESLIAASPEKVLIHDAARPFVPARVIDDVIDALDDADGACAGLPVVDAIWQTEDGHALNPVSRDGLWRAQTPQGFRFERILAAHRASDGTAADDVAVAHQHDLRVRFVHGSERNYKITLPTDLQRALADVEREDRRAGPRPGQG